MNTIELTEVEINQLGVIAHDVWSNWYIHQRDNSTKENIEIWNRQSSLGYYELSDEDSKKDDMIIKKYYEGLINSLLLDRYNKGKEEGINYMKEKLCTKCGRFHSEGDMCEELLPF